MNLAIEFERDVLESRVVALERVLFGAPIVSQVQPKAAQIIGFVAARHGITVEQITGRRRQDYIVIPRHIAMCLLREELKLTLCNIAALFDRDHGTVMFALESIHHRAEGQPDFKAHLEKMRESVQLILKP